MPVGSDAMDALILGAGATQGMNAAVNGVPVMAGGSSQALSAYVEYNNQITAYNQQQTAVSRAGDSPFDIYNNATFLGSIMGNFIAGLYSNGNSPFGMAQSLLGMFGGGVASILQGTPTYADAASDTYANSCSDGDISSAGIAADPFCNPIYGMNDSDVSETGPINILNSKASGYSTTYGVDMNAYISQRPLQNQHCPGDIDCDGQRHSDDKSGQDYTYAGGSHPYDYTVGDFISECVTRNYNKKFTPMGMYDKNNQTTMGSGKDCVIGGGGKWSDSTLRTLYNYFQYFLANSGINQGSNLGS
jgi:hypothetical protein